MGDLSVGDKLLHASAYFVLFLVWKFSFFLKLSLGISGKIPYESLKHLTASVEGTLNIKDSYSGLYMALHFPIN